jgi:hypothetical protein
LLETPIFILLIIYFFRKTLFFVEFASNWRNTHHENFYKQVGGRAVDFIRGRELTCDAVKTFEIVLKQLLFALQIMTTVFQEVKE